MQPNVMAYYSNDQLMIKRVCLWSKEICSLCRFEQKGEMRLNQFCSQCKCLPLIDRKILRFISYPWMKRIKMVWSLICSFCWTIILTFVCNLFDIFYLNLFNFCSSFWKVCLCDVHIILWYPVDLHRLIDVRYYFMNHQLFMMDQDFNYLLKINRLL